MSLEHLSTVTQFLATTGVVLELPEDRSSALSGSVQVLRSADSLLLTTNPEKGGVGLALEFTMHDREVGFEVRRQGTLGQLEEYRRAQGGVVDVYRPITAMSRVSRVVLGADFISVTGGARGAKPNVSQDVGIIFSQQQVTERLVTSLAS